MPSATVSIKARLDLGPEGRQGLLESVPADVTLDAEGQAALERDLETNQDLAVRLFHILKRAWALCENLSKKEPLPREADEAVTNVSALANRHAAPEEGT